MVLAPEKINKFKDLIPFIEHDPNFLLLPDCVNQKVEGAGNTYFEQLLIVDQGIMIYCCSHPYGTGEIYIQRYLGYLGGFPSLTSDLWGWRNKLQGELKDDLSSRQDFSFEELLEYLGAQNVPYLNLFLFHLDLFN